jgi:Ca2+-binding EF-hand superfamily protein
MTHRIRLGTPLLLVLVAVALQPAVAASSTEVVAKYDKDGDKTLDMDEVKAAVGAHFDRLDKDADHSLDNKEAAGALGPKAFAAADQDHDGTLSKEECVALAEKLFKRADVDHDGTLSAAELNSRSGKELVRLMG